MCVAYDRKMIIVRYKVGNKSSYVNATGRSISTYIANMFQGYESGHNIVFFERCIYFITNVRVGTVANNHIVNMNFPFAFPTIYIPAIISVDSCNITIFH